MKFVILLTVLYDYNNFYLIVFIMVFLIFIETA